MPDLPYGSLRDGMEKLAKMPRMLQTRIERARCHLNLNQIWDFYQRYGMQATIQAIDQDEYAVVANRRAAERHLIYECGHVHESHAEAQRCTVWLRLARDQ